MGKENRTLRMLIYMGNPPLNGKPPRHCSDLWMIIIYCSFMAVLIGKIACWSSFYRFFHIHILKLWACHNMICSVSSKTPKIFVNQFDLSKVCEAFFSIPNFQLWNFHKKMWKRDVYPQTVQPHQGFPRCHEATLIEGLTALGEQKEWLPHRNNFSATVLEM